MIVSFLVRRLGRAIGLRPAMLRVAETMATTGIVVILAFGTGVLSARMLGPEGRGELASILLGLQMAAPLAALGLPAAAIYTLKKNPGQRSQLVGATLLLAVAYGLVVAMAGMMIVPAWLDRYDPWVVLAAQAALAATPFWALLQVATPILRARDEFRIFNGVRVITPTATILCLLALWLSGVDSPQTVAIPYVLSACVFVFWPLAWIWRDCRPTLRGIGDAVRQVLDYGARSVVVDLVQTISRFLDRIVLVYMLAPAAVGLYVVAASMAKALQELGTAITLVLFPKASEYGREEAIAISGLAGRVALMMLVAIGGPMLVIAPILLRLIFGEAFLPAVPAFRYLVIAVVLTCTADTLAQAFMATGRPGTVSILRFMEAATLATLLFVLVPGEGMVGAAWAVLAAAIVRFVATLVCYPLVLRVMPPRFYLNGADLRRMRTARGAAPTQTG